MISMEVLGLDRLQQRLKAGFRLSPSAMLRVGEAQRLRILRRLKGVTVEVGKATGNSVNLVVERAAVGLRGRGHKEKPGPGYRDRPPRRRTLGPLGRVPRVPLVGATLRERKAIGKDILAELKKANQAGLPLTEGIEN